MRREPRYTHGLTAEDIGKMVSLVILGAVFVALLWFLPSQAERHEAAVQAAHAWTSELYPEADARVLCVTRDSDGDGYVSCTVRVEQEVIALDCSMQACRISKPNAPRVNISNPAMW